MQASLSGHTNVPVFSPRETITSPEKVVQGLCTHRCWTRGAKGAPHMPWPEAVITTKHMVSAFSTLTLKIVSEPLCLYGEIDQNNCCTIAIHVDS